MLRNKRDKMEFIRLPYVPNFDTVGWIRTAIDYIRCKEWRYRHTIRFRLRSLEVELKSADNLKCAVIRKFRIVCLCKLMLEFATKPDASERWEAVEELCHMRVLMDAIRQILRKRTEKVEWLVYQNLFNRILADRLQRKFMAVRVSTRCFD